MSPGFAEQKEQLRQQIRQRLRTLSSEEKAERSRLACALLVQQPVWQKARSILFYAPLQDEPDLWPMVALALQQAKEVALPRYVPEDQQYVACRILSLDPPLPQGKFGILEPGPDCPLFPLNRLDLTLVPGLVFAVNGRRLGRGKGFYDRLLAQVSGTRCGVAFDEQFEADLPWEPHDILLNCILTPTRWLRCDQSAVLK
ncbi:MAG: 5-formyltetrahydrofolate cyclo-ligase [Verrucomicrobiota bacterium]|jgi:5-formyltetrahydrofolate cyclo-ligase